MNRETAKGNLGRARLERLWKPGKDFLGTDVAIMGGAMTWVSERHLVSALSNAGAFGVIASGSMSPKLLDREIAATQQMTNKPFGVNLITLHPELDQLIEVCLKRAVGHIVLAGGLPKGSAIQKIKGGGAKLICFTPTVALGKKLVRGGVDALVIEGAEAGGHIGPVSTAVLAQEVLPQIREVPVFVAGGIGRGEAMAGYLQMGASGCQLGTRFVCAHESQAHPRFKQAFIRASARDAVLSVQLDPRFPVIPVRALKNAATQTFIEFQRETIARFHAGELDQKEAQLEIERFWAGALRRGAMEGDIESGSLMAGQSVGMVTSEQTVAEIIDELTAQAAAFLEHATN